ncbi:MAG: ompW [Pedosphaera sp.]|nr:ompW [Pedosphaera sp.]
MKGILKTGVCSILFFALIASHSARAQMALGGSETNAPNLLEDNFRSGRFEATLAAGPLFSPVGSQNRPVLNYAIGAFQLGYMLTEPGHGGFFRGNFEFVPEAFGAGITKGKGNYIAGTTLWGRYNFIQRGWHVTPYAQLGAGFEFTDLDRSMLGQSFNFNLDAAGGLRYFIARRCSLNLEYRFQHFSNAGLSRKNVGVNAQGPVLGVSWFF